MFIKIGDKEYQSKKETVNYYRSILNSYSFGESLNESDLNDLIDLLNYGCLPETDVEPYIIEDIKVSKVQFSTKCFEVFYPDKTSRYISYLLLIRSIGLNTVYYTPEKMFYTACRNAVNKDIHRVKSRYFKNSKQGTAKCQETGILSKWDELVVDHRQPNTFSVILDRFKELNNIDLDSIEYTADNKNNIIFVDSELSEKFRQYHKEKANLRIVRRECNSGRTGMSRIKRTNNDLSIETSL
jgi:hypothetical protein